MIHSLRSGKANQRPNRSTILRRSQKGEIAMKNKWFLKLLGSLLAVFLVTGCNADDQDPPPEDDGLETPGEDMNEEMDNEVVPDVTPEEDGGNNGNNGNGTNGDGNLMEDDNNDGDVDMGKDDKDELGDTLDDDEQAPGGGTGGDAGGAGGAGGGQ